MNNLRPSVFIYSDGFKQNQFRTISKRVLDITSSTILLILTLPIMLLTVVAIFVESGCRGSIIYRQVRVGINHQSFKIFKFR
ncbi:sugar transferase, partial [Isoptericola croceus]|uniref:sugar transferase n=1 Tax=Isoptericola croceus TaxID=3031406 RepID=UPI0034D58C0D